MFQICRHSAPSVSAADSVQAAFSRLSEGKTVIMIAHRLSTVTNVDQIFVIQDGQVAECGNSRELLAKDGIFSRMWKNYQTSVQWKVTKEVTNYK